MDKLSHKGGVRGLISHTVLKLGLFSLFWFFLLILLNLWFENVRKHIDVALMFFLL